MPRLGRLQIPIASDRFRSLPMTSDGFRWLPIAFDGFRLLPIASDRLRRWGLPDSGLEKHDYNLMMQGLKLYCCALCLCEFGCVSATHRCPLCTCKVWAWRRLHPATDCLESLRTGTCFPMSSQLRYPPCRPSARVAVRLPPKRLPPAAQLRQLQGSMQEGSDLRLHAVHRARARGGEICRSICHHLQRSPIMLLQANPEAPLCPSPVLHSPPLPRPFLSSLTSGHGRRSCASS